MPGDEIIYENQHDAVNEFIQKKKAMGRSPRTLTEYSRTLKKFFHQHYPEKAPGEITVGDIENYVIKLDERGLAQNTKRRYLESLSAFYGWTLKRPRFTEITGDPAGVVLEEIPKQVHDRPDCATWNNGKKIIHAIGDPRDKTVAILMAKTGCRVSEALNIKNDDLLLDEGFIRLTDRKGGKQTVVPIDDETIHALKRYQFVRRDYGTDYLFVSIRGNPLNRERIRRSIRKAAVETEVMKQGESRFHRKFTPHTYRTIFTTLMRNQGMPDHILQYIRGDANSDTMDIYTRIDRSTAREHYLNCIKKIQL